MCLSTKEKPVVINKDFICYKVVKVKRFLFWRRWYSPYMGTRLYRVNEARLNARCMRYGGIMMYDEGIHAFSELEDAVELMASRGLGERVAVCVVPARTTLVFGGLADLYDRRVLAAEKLIIKEIL